MFHFKEPISKCSFASVLILFSLPGNFSNSKHCSGSLARFESVINSVVKKISKKTGAMKENGELVLLV